MITIDFSQFDWMGMLVGLITGCLICLFIIGPIMRSIFRS